MKIYYKDNVDDNKSLGCIELDGNMPPNSNGVSKSGYSKHLGFRPRKHDARTSKLIICSMSWTVARLYISMLKMFIIGKEREWFQ